jgi:hypothetical protein
VTTTGMILLSIFVLSFFSAMHRLFRIDAFFSNDIHIVKDFVVPDVRLGAVHGSCVSHPRRGLNGKAGWLVVSVVQRNYMYRIPQKRTSDAFVRGTAAQ